MSIHDMMDEAYFLFLYKVFKCPCSPACNHEGSKRKGTPIAVAGIAPISHEAPRFFLINCHWSASSAELGSVVPSEVRQAAQAQAPLDT